MIKLVKTIEISDELYEYLSEKCIEENEEFEKKQAVWDSKKSLSNKGLLSPEEYEIIIKEFDDHKKQLELYLALALIKEQTDGSKKNTSDIQPTMIEPISGNIKPLESIMEITNHAISKELPNGTVIRLRFRKENYQTQINSSNNRYKTLSSLFNKHFHASVNIWRQNIYFKDEKGWWSLRSLLTN